MSTLVFSSAADKNYSEFVGSSAPRGIGVLFGVSNGGDINIGTTYEGIILTSASFQCSGYSGNYNLYGNIWTGAGDCIHTSPAVAGGVDTSSPYGLKTFNFADRYLAPGSYFVGFSRLSGDWMAWDANSDNPYTTRYTSSYGPSPDGLVTNYGRTLIGSVTYTLYDSGNLTWAGTHIADRTAQVTFSGTCGNFGKDVTIAWGDGTTTSYTVAAGATPASKTHQYATAGTRTITVTIEYADPVVAIPVITISHSFTASTVPGAPGVTVTAGAYGVNVTYSAPADNGGSAVTGYEYSVDGATWYSQNTSPFGVSAAAKESKTVYVRALNQWGAGPSASGTATAYGVPSAPTVSAVSGVGKITVTYSAPADNGGNAITSYQYSTNAGSSWTTAPASPFDISGPNGVGIGVYVRAVNAAGGGASGYAYAGPYTVPDAPTITAPTGNSITDVPDQIPAAWTPNGNGGSAITRYEYSFDGVSYTNLGNVTSALFSGLARRTSYTLRIRAVNAAGAGAPASVTVTTGGGRVYRYNASGQWEKVFVMTGGGSMATVAPVKFYNGSSWVYTNV